VGRPRAQFPALVDVNIDGIVIGSHALTKNVERLERILNVVGRRLAHWLKSTADTQPLPPEEWTENFKFYSSALTNLLKEQRERYRLTQHDQATPEQLQAQFREELQRALQSFTPQERAFTLALWDASATTTTETPQ